MSRIQHTSSRNSSRAALLAAVILMSLMLLIVYGSPAAFAEESSADIDKRVKVTQETLTQLKADLAALDLQIQTHGADLEKSRLDMAEANSRVRAAEDRYNEVLAIYESRIIALYKNGDHQFFDLIMSSEGINDATTRISYLGKISENDQKLISRVKTEERSLRLAREEIENLKQVNHESVESLQAKKMELVSRIAELQKSLDADLIKLETARAIEQEAAAQRLAEEAAMVDFAGLYSGVAVIQSQPPAGLQPTGTVLRGVTSWYGPGFHGNRTANGETYNMYAYTAAHKSLPFNTWLKVTYNGRSVFVRINDRGPYVGERFLDLSKASAQSLGISGVAYVTAEIYR